MVYRNNGVHPRHSGTPQTIIIQFDCCQVKRERDGEKERFNGIEVLSKQLILSACCHSCILAKQPIVSPSTPTQVKVYVFARTV